MRKNILIIDAALNCAYDIFQCSVTDFELIFPKVNQDIEFIEDVRERIDSETLERMLARLWSCPVKKAEAQGIHGILFFELRDVKKDFYPNKRDSDLDLFGRK